YYTNWSRTFGQICVNDCQNDGGNVYPTMEDCCQAHHGFSGPGGLNDCLGVTESPTGTVTIAPTGSPTPGPSKAPAPCLYYTNWGQTPGQICVNDCQNDGGEVFPTMQACCEAKHGYAGPGGLYDCLGITGNDMETYSNSAIKASESSEPIPCMYYTKDGDCVNDCGHDGQSWPPLHASLEDCCGAHHNWAGPGGYEQCVGITR
ncbi:hypothetical protein ACHAWF_000636, partial [Thalassiosira exigua]